ncbi:class I SAM-dependent methyltransferase [Streptomyces chartreusis]|uniref:Class I SAM-dependent methyltransferase n=1 Tax=Streptomyces chartreusis TaxID=1969 RepID=A0A7I0Y8W2_STRCX|nr:class I SAM-dependent methyltransferase [Streptomyces chartreusis]QKZ15943.1 class I SAM-dependent methyltransferase [Streptomyces chartreusis]
MANEVSFQPDLYQGTASYYDRFRLSYPDSMLTDLSRRTRPSGHGRLLELACGTGQLAFPLRGRFADVWAVDAEFDMTHAIRAKAAATEGAAHVRAVTAKAEELDMDAGSVELIVIGNAFHRLRRDLVAQRALTWLEPGGYLALCWSTSPWAGPLDWQQAFGRLLRRWQEALGATSRIPPGAEEQRQADPDQDVLSRAGFDPADRQQFAVEHRWTINELAGHVRSTSFLPPPVLADRAPEFDLDLMTELSPYVIDGHLTETVSFAYDLAHKAAPAAS